MPVHIAQHRIGNMLQRNIQVLAYLRIISHLLKYVFRKIGGVGIMDSQALHPFDCRQAREQLGKSPASVQVKPVEGSVLGNQYKFAYTFSHKAPRLLFQLLEGHRTVRPADERNSAVGAAAVAALGNLQVRIPALLLLPTADES